MTALDPSTLPATPTRRAGWGLGVAMGVANLLGYVFAAILSRGLGPEDFGAFAAVNNVGILLAIPAGAIQVVVARHQASDGDTGLRLAGELGIFLAVLGALLAPLGAALFHLDSAWVVVAAMAALVPMTVTGALQGVLLGQGRLGALGAVYLLTGVLRVAAALAAVRLGHGVLGTFVLVLVAAVLTAAAAAALCRVELSRSGHGTGLTTLTDLARELVRSNTTLAALIALTSADVLLARHYLSAADSGFYALASIFGKVVFWGTQFTALLVVPALHPANARRRILEGAAVVVLAGAAAALLVTVAPDLLIRLSGGSTYADATGLLLGFTVLGTLWGLAQILLFAEMASGRSRLGLLTWGVVLAEVAVVVLVEHAHAFRILLVAIAAAALLCAWGFVAVVRTPARDLEVSSS